MIIFVRYEGEITSRFIKQPLTFSKNILAGCAILLAGYDGKVTSDRPKAGEDL